MLLRFRAILATPAGARRVSGARAVAAMRRKADKIRKVQARAQRAWAEYDATRFERRFTRFERCADTSAKSPGTSKKDTRA